MKGKKRAKEAARAHLDRVLAAFPAGVLLAPVGQVPFHDTTVEIARRSYRVRLDFHPVGGQQSHAVRLISTCTGTAMREYIKAVAVDAIVVLPAGDAPIGAPHDPSPTSGGARGTRLP